MLFDNTPEKRIAREADKVASLKEDLDAISWGRVLEIGKQLQGKGAAEAELGAELVSIAQSNLSLATRLGIDPAPLENRVMASGVKIVEGGLAQAAIDASRVPVGSGAASPSPTASRGEAGRADEPARAASESDGETQPIELPGSFSICIERPESGMADGGLSLKELMEASRRLDDEGGATFRSKMPDEAAAFDPQEPPSRIVPRSTTELPIDLPRIPRIGDVPVAAEPSEGRADDATETEEETLFEPALPPEAPLGGIAIVDGEADGAADAPAGTPGEDAVAAIKRACEAFSEPEPEPEPEPTAAPAAGEPAACGGAVPDEAGSRVEQPGRERFARFRNLYESRDGSLCVFEDEHGHLVAVDASKLA
ncbi:MAG TPA: hypothetical protein K8W22_05945 [Gordonibacter urolithinfaciens]|uniref:hypothetical protein n=1 Tax=Gordonibacter urolithinfaciens TaxID=1335613 RepID=UPI001DDE5D6B|nr:hypothetical protein [Gordonibacter urolithinfaciens]HJF62981.1 hypothetical protein [Gordonibacter urolithinfaciens]